MIPYLAPYRHYFHFLHRYGLKAKIEPTLILIVVAIAAYWLWKRASNSGRLVMVVTAVVLFVGYRVWRHLPPYEDGVHTSVVEAGVDPLKPDAPHLGTCPAFPANNVWNTPIDSLPKDSHSADYLASIGDHSLHPDFSSNLDTGIPYSFIPANTKRVKVSFEYRDDSDLSNYPIPPDAPIEGGPSATGDRHILLVEQRRCLLYELYDAHPQPDGSWKAGSGIIMDLTSNALRGDGKTSADAAGLPILPGLVRYDEVQAGAINHALRFTVLHTRGEYIWPARHKASRITDPKVPPMGVRLRLRADFDISRYSKSNQVILTALKKYGMFLADNGSSIFLSGVSDKRWDDGDLDRLKDLKTSDFEAVDEDGYQMMSDSARVDPLALKH
jgi:hypothetical protein